MTRLTGRSSGTERSTAKLSLGTVVVAVLLALTLGGVGAAWQQAPSDGQGYTPSYLPPAGSELVFVLVSSPGCVANYEPEFDDAIREAKAILSARADSGGRPFSAVGVSVNWVVSDGVDYLLDGRWKGEGDLDFGAWDEIVVGRNWGNSAALKYMTELAPGCPGAPDVVQAVPQAYVLERMAEEWEGTGMFLFGPESVRAHFCGGDQIVEWVNSGALFPE